MLNIEYTHSSSSSSNSKTFAFTGVEGMTIDQKVPQQCQLIVQYAYTMSLDQPLFTLNDLVAYIENRCNDEGVTFTRSKGGVDRIVRYYSKLLQNIGVITDINASESE